ncbi:hypothetical protein BDF14DRAFT_1808260 [Spinellus fusiger]|nr:hypothetical protein BDF14DRAFT_1808260 [Spinellus fusiger]
MSRFSALEDFTEIAQPSLKDVEFFRFNSLVPDAKIALQDSQFSFEKYPANVSLLACSSKYGYFVAGSIHGFLFGDTKSVRDALHKAGKGKVEKLEKKTTIPIEQGPVHQLRLSADELSVVVAVAGGHVFIYSVKDIVANGQNTQPTKHYQLGGDILDLRPNPEDLPNLCAIRMKESCVIIKLDSGEIALTLDRQDITAICWSPKGKQIVCGTHLGQLYHYDTQGNQKDSIDIPKEMRGGVEDESENRYVQDVLWVETHVFLAIYSRRRETSNDEHVNDAYAIKRSIKSGSVAYTRLAEVTPVFSCDGRDGHFYMETIRDFGREIKHLIILANTATGEVSVVGEDENQEWATWMLEETGIANLPLSEEDSTDTFPLGLALDFSSMEPLPPFDQSESEKNVDPMPTIYFINDEGHMLAYHCYNKEMARRGEAFKGMKESQSVHYALTTAPAPVQPASAFVAALSSNNVNTTPTFGQLNQFAQYDSGANTTSSFASLLSGDETGSNAISTTGVFGAAIQKQQSGSAFSGFASANISTTPTEKSSLFRTLAVNSAVPSAPTPGRMGQGTPAFGAPSMPAFGATTAIGYGQNLSSVATPIQPLVAFSTQANNDKANNDTPTAPAPAPAPPTSTSTSTSSPAEPVKSTGFVGFGQTQPFGEMKSVFPLKKSADVGFGFGSSPTSSFSQPSPVPVPIFGSASKTPAFGENKPVTSSSLANDSKPVQPSEKKMPDFGSLALSTPPPKEVKPSAFSVSQTATSDAKIPAFGGIKSSSTPKVLFTAPKPVVPAPEDESEKDDEKEEESEEEFSMGSSRLHLATPGPLNSTSYRPNSVPAATESKLVFNFGTSKPVFAVPAPPASNLSSVSTAEPKKSFAHRSDFVSPVAEVKKNNVFDTKSMSPPSEVKQEHVFAVPEPKFGLSFGSTKPAASSPVPPLKQSATSFKSVSFSPVTPSKAESQYKTDEISPPKPRVSTAKEVRLIDIDRYKPECIKLEYYADDDNCREWQRHSKWCTLRFLIALIL